MTIDEVLQQLKTSEHPVARILHKTEHCKVLVIGFNSGMILKEHKTQVGGKLTVLLGHIIYKQGDTEIEAFQFDEIIIPVDIVHSVMAIDDSLCLLSL